CFGSKMKTEARKKAVEMRKAGASYGEIKRRLNVSKSTLSYWLREMPLAPKRLLELRRKGWSKGEASREKYRETMRRKKEDRSRKIYDKYAERFSRLSDDSIFVAGLMLYLAEGAKKKESTIVIANTDSGVIKFFMRWLEKYFGIDRSEFRIQLHLYEDMDLNKERNFWKKELVIGSNQIYKLSVRKLRPASFTYKDSFRHGTCSLYAFGVDRVVEIMSAMRAFVDTVNKNK
ncbi:MAG TPA: hypothetical protein P5056_00490, partial [Candidatus Paceibacterota bacterium]|nr:hypothetical protein [Candidatus Paceibacterota bacterium]